MTVSGEAARTFCTKSVTALLPCTVAVGLFGLFRNTRPAPLAAAAIASRSRRSAASTLTSVTGCPSFFANCGQFSNDGAAVTRPRVGDVKARTALFRISCEPAPSTTFSFLAPNFVAMAATRALSAGVLLNG